MKLNSVVDSHVHSNFSPDSKISLDAGCKKALDIGLGGVAFTDHLELDLPGTIYEMSSDLIDSIITRRSLQIDILRKNFDENLKILKGLELGYQSNIIDQASLIVKKYDFDFIILSTHLVDRLDISKSEFFMNKTKEQAFSLYLNTVYESVNNFKDFDVIGHIGYICRYIPIGNKVTDKAMLYKDYSDILDAIFKKTIENNKGIEVNTAGFFYNLGFSHPAFDSLKRYKELGGEIITIGSDSHNQETIGNNFEFVIDQLKSIGFRYITYFEKRKPAFVKI